MFRFYPCPDTIYVHRSNSFYSFASKSKISLWNHDRKSRTRLATGGVFTSTCLGSLSEESEILHFSKRRTFLISRVLNLVMQCHGSSHGAAFQYSHKTTRSRCPRGLRLGYAAARLLGVRFRISPRAWMGLPLVSVLCC